MSGSNVLVDTNVVINHLSGNKSIEALLENNIVYISSLTLTELLSGNISNKEILILKDYLKETQIIHTNDFICETAALLRRTYKLKLPDALIASTSLFLDLPLITFDNDFDKIDDLKIIKLKF